MKFLYLCQLQQAETQPVAGGAGVFYTVFLAVEGGAQPFAVQMADLEEATLTLDGKEYPCPKGGKWSIATMGRPCESFCAL